MRSRSIILLLIILSFPVMQAMAGSFTISFTAGDIKSIMASSSYNDPLSDANYLWGLWSIRAMPIVAGGGFDITSGWVDDKVDGDFWIYAEPSDIAWADPYGTEVASFYLRPASEHFDTDAHPLYLMTDQPAEAFQSYAFDNTIENGFRRSEYLGVCGIDVPADYPGCNVTNVLSDQALFNFSFSVDPGTSLLGWQFLVDGSKYYMMGMQPIGWSSNSLWVEDFIGGDQWLSYVPFHQSEGGGGLTHNVGSGYQVLFPVPEPSTLILVGLGFAAAGIARRRTS